MPIYYGLVHTVNCYNYYRGTERIVQSWVIISAIFLQGMMQFVSYLFLAIGVWRIRAYLKKSPFKNHINSEMMCVHVLCFSVYIMGGMAFQMFIDFYYISNNDSLQQITLVLMIICCCLDFLISITLAYIFAKIGNQEQCKIMKRYSEQNGPCANQY